MRAAPPVQAPLARGRWARATVCGLYTLAGVACAAWAQGWLNLLSPSAVGLIAPFVVGSTAASAVAAFGLVFLAGLLGWRQAVRLFPPQPGVLAWTGSAWQWQPVPGMGTLVSAAGARPITHGALPILRLQLMLDFGTWVLLRWQWADTEPPAALRPARLVRRLCWRPSPWCWACANQATQPSAWHSLRVALLAHGQASTE